MTTTGLLPPDETIELPFPFNDTEYTVPILQEWMNYIFSQQLARWDNARACNHVDHKKYKDTILDIGSEFAEKAENDDFDVIYLALATLLTNYNLFPIDNQGLRRKIGLAASRSIQAYVNSVSAREKGDFRYEKDHLFFDINNLQRVETGQSLTEREQQPTALTELLPKNNLNRPNTLLNIQNPKV